MNRIYLITPNKDPSHTYIVVANNEKEAHEIACMNSDEYTKLVNAIEDACFEPHDTSKGYVDCI